MGARMQRALERGVVVRALRLTAVVAPVLILLNHGACLLEGSFGLLCAGQAAATTVVPFLVAVTAGSAAGLEGRMS